MRQSLGFSLSTSSTALGFALAALALTTSDASATYNGLSAQLHNTVVIDGVARSVYRVYANFTNLDDGVYTVYGSPTLGALTLQSLNSLGTGPGSAFYNSPIDGNKAPTLGNIATDPNTQWDTFGTIGVSIANQAPYGDQVFLSPGLAPIAGSTYSTSNGGWLLTPTINEDGNPSTPQIVNPQSTAGFLGDGDALPRVLLFQLTVNAGNHVAGVLNLAVHDHQANDTVVLAQQTFSSIPAPATIGLLGMGLLARRRRR